MKTLAPRKHKKEQTAKYTITMRPTFWEKAHRITDATGETVSGLLRRLIHEEHMRRHANGEVRK